MRTRWSSGARASKVAGAALKPSVSPQRAQPGPPWANTTARPPARTRGLLKFNCCGSLLTFHGSFPTGAGSLRWFGLIRSDFGKGLIANGKLSGANEPQPGGSQSYWSAPRNFEARAVQARG